MRRSSFARCAPSYTPFLEWSLGRLAISIIALGLGFLAVSGLVATRLGSEFLPALEEGNYWLHANMPPTMSLEAGTASVAKMREILLRHS